MALTNTTGAAPSALSTTGGTSSSTLSEWAGPYVTEMLGKTQAIADMPYSVYQGPMTADTSSLQNKVFQGLGNLAFPGNLGGSFSSQDAYQVPTMTANGVTGQNTGPTGIAAQYMNPYLNAVLTPQLQELQRQSQITQLGNAGKLTQAGAYGGSRQAIMDAETQRNLLGEQNKAIGTAYANAFDQGRAQFNTEQGQAKTLADIMGAAGTAQRGIEQEGITADYNEFLAQRDYPQKMLQFQQSMLQGLPISTVTNSPAQQSGIGQLSSSIGGLGSLFTNLKNLGVTLGG